MQNETPTPRLLIVRLNENLPANVLAGAEYQLPLMVLSSKNKVLSSSTEPSGTKGYGKRIVGNIGRAIQSCTLLVRDKNNKEVPSSVVNTSLVDESSPIMGFKVKFMDSSAGGEFHISLRSTHNPEHLDASLALPGIVVKSYKYLLRVTEYRSNGERLLGDLCEDTKNNDDRDQLGLKYPNLTWYKDEKGKESNFIECKLSVVDSHGECADHGDVVSSLSAVLFYCREESINKGKGDVMGKKNAITGGSGSGGNLDEWEGVGQCTRSDVLTEVGDQTIMNVMAKGIKGDFDAEAGKPFARIRIEEVSKNHQSNFFRVRMNTDATINGFEVGSCQTRRIYVKSKISKSAKAAAGGSAKAMKKVAGGGQVTNLPPAYLMKASLATIQSAHLQAFSLLQEYHRGKANSALHGQCEQVLKEYSSTVLSSYAYLYDSISALEMASSQGKGSRQATVGGGGAAGGGGKRSAVEMPWNEYAPSSSKKSKVLDEGEISHDETTSMSLAPPPTAPSLKNHQSLSMNLSLFNEIMEQGGEYGVQPISETEPYDPDEEPPPQNPGLANKVSSHYIGPGKDLRRTETTNLNSTLSQFPSTELAIGASRPPRTKVPESTVIQNSVYYILAKLWCGEPGEQGSNAIAYGFPAFDNMFNVLGFYREVYDTDLTKEGGEGEEEDELNNAIGVFVPITDRRELGKKQREEMSAKLKKEIRAKSASVCKLNDCGDKLETLIAEGFTYVWTKMMTGGQSMGMSTMSGSWW